MYAVVSIAEPYKRQGMANGLRCSEIDEHRWPRSIKEWR